MNLPAEHINLLWSQDKQSSVLSAEGKPEMPQGPVFLKTSTFYLCSVQEAAQMFPCSGGIQGSLQQQNVSKGQLWVFEQLLRAAQAG